MTPSLDVVILRRLDRRTTARAAEIGIACRTAAAEVRARLAALNRRSVASQSDRDVTQSRRVYVIAAEGGPVKAGVAANRQSRLAALRTDPL